MCYQISVYLWDQEKQKTIATQTDHSTTEVKLQMVLDWGC